MLCSALKGKARMPYYVYSGDMLGISRCFTTDSAPLKSRRHSLDQQPASSKQAQRTKRLSPALSYGERQTPDPAAVVPQRHHRPTYRYGSSEYRTSRRYALRDRPDVTEGHTRPSQRPFGVAQEIQKIMVQGTLDEAIKMVTSAPISSQNEVVWTILIKQALKDDRANLAYELYNDVSFDTMKKRGFIPTGRNYTTILSGYNKLSELTPKQWERVTKIWEHYESYLEACRGRDSVEGNEVLSPHVPYFEMLGRLGKHDRIVAIFESMDATGPLAPDKFLCTTVLGLIARRRRIDGLQRDDAYAGNASMIAKIACRMIQGGMIDTFALCSILRGLVKGKDEHLQFAWDILLKQVGNVSDSKVFADPKMEIDHFLFDVILELCCAMGKYDLAIDLVDQAIKSKKMKTIVTRSHIHYALDALSYRAAAHGSKPSNLPEIRSPARTPSPSSSSTPSPASSPSSPSSTQLNISEKALSLLEFILLEAYSGHPKDILPNLSTYHRVLVIAWRTNDWITAMRVFQIMTGLDPAHFSDASFQGTPKSSKTPRTVVDMDAQSLSYIVRIACARDEVPLIKTALRISSHYGAGKMSSSSKGGSGDVAFYRYKHAAAMQEAIIRVMQESLSQEERTSYKRLLEVVKMKKAKLQYDLSDTNA